MSRELFAILRQQSLLPSAGGAGGSSGGGGAALAGDASAALSGGGGGGVAGAGGAASAPSSATAVAGAGRARMSSSSMMMDLPSLMPSVAATHTVVQKRRSLAKANRWVWQAFRNPARTDNLELHHWTRVSTADAHGATPPHRHVLLVARVLTVRSYSRAGYAFARFNKPVDMFDYTDDEYEAHLQGALNDLLVSACARARS
jgi:hypothetical protein